MYALVVGGLLLLAAEWLKPKKPRAVGLDDITYRQAFMIGCFQCLALWPGFPVPAPPFRAVCWLA